MENIMNKVDKMLNEMFDQMVENYIGEGYDKQEILDKVSYLKDNGYEMHDLLNMYKIYPDYLKFDVKNNLSGTNHLKKYGFNNQEIKKLVLNNPVLFILSEKKADAFLAHPLSPEIATKKNYAKLLCNAAISTDAMVNKLKKELGYNYEEALRINDHFSMNVDCFKLPHNYPEYFKNIINKYVDYGFNKEDALKATSYCPEVLEANDNYKKGIIDLPESIKVFEKLNYNKNDIIEMTKRAPGILKAKTEDIKDVIGFLYVNGFQKDEIIKTTIENPKLFQIMNSIKIVDNIFLYDNPKLLESLKTIPKKTEKDYKNTYRRYQFLKDNGYQIDNSNFKSLFGDDQEFTTKYGMTDNLLSDIYNPFEQTKKIFSFVLKPEKIKRKTK